MNIIFLIIGPEKVFSQNKNDNELFELLKKKKYSSCITKADKVIAETPEQPIPHFYKAIAIYLDSKEGEKKTKEKEEAFKTCMFELKESRKKWTLDTALLVSPNLMINIQALAISNVKKKYAAKKASEAEALIAEYMEIFDNKWAAFTNYTFISLFNVLSGYAESSKTDKEKIYKQQEKCFFTYINSLPKNMDIANVRKIQLSFLAHYKKLNETGFETMADEQLDFIFQKYDNSDDDKTNYISNDINNYFTNLILKSDQKNKEIYTLRFNKIIDKYPVVFNKKASCGFIKKYCFKEWDEPQYYIANTAKNTSYLTQDEKDIIYIMNLARINPKLFKDTFVKKYIKVPSTAAEKSLIAFLEQQQPLSLLYPSEKLFKSSEFHAKDMGATGKTGHSSSDNTSFEKRLKRYWKYSLAGENCSYGPSDPIEIVFQLMIDEGVSGYGHRMNIFDKEYLFVGTSIKPHNRYGWNTVMDFGGSEE